jgi:hypothetical protein
MLKIPFATWIANAAAGLTGIYGAATRQAEVADWSRQTISDHARKVQAALEDAHDGGPTRAQLIERNQSLRQENAQLWGRLAQSLEFSPSKQRESSVTAAAMGLSLNQIIVLLALILGDQACPGRSTLHRGIKAAGLAAGRVLKCLEAWCKALVLVGCLEEIFFHGRPVLVGIEPASLVWFLGQKAGDRSGATWATALRPWEALSYITADAGTGLQAGIATVQQEWQQDGGGGVGERPGCIPHDAGGAAGVASGLESGGTMLGTGRSGDPPGRAGSAIRPGCPRRGGRGTFCLEEGRGGVRSLRALRSGLEDGPWRAVGVSSRRSLERPSLG